MDPLQKTANNVTLVAQALDKLQKDIAQELIDNAAEVSRLREALQSAEVELAHRDEPPAGSEFPAPGTRWAHKNGNVYEVVMLSNLGSADPKRYPVYITYKGANGLVWTRALHDWHRSMTALASHDVQP
jgi:hypothetical protein